LEVTVNNKEENSEDLCPNYVQEFGLWNLKAVSLRTLKRTLDIPSKEKAIGSTFRTVPEEFFNFLFYRYITYSQ
jgi:hypothetical protein